jgi:hypothetical protein
MLPFLFVFFSLTFSYSSFLRFAGSSYANLKALCTEREATFPLLIARIFAQALMEGNPTNADNDIVSCLNPFLVFSSNLWESDSDVQFCELISEQFISFALQRNLSPQDIKKVVTIGHYRTLFSVLKRNASTLSPLSPFHEKLQHLVIAATKRGQGKIAIGSKTINVPFYFAFFLIYHLLLFLFSDCFRWYSH